MLLISDANIFIDFDCCGLIAELFTLPEDIATPDAMFYEELQEQHPELLDLGLQLMIVSGEGVEYALKLHNDFSEPGINDLLALSLAKERDCPLVTGDGKLRIVAMQEKVELKGSIWLMQRLIEQGIVTIEQAKTAFKTMRENKRRLPWAKAVQMLQELA